MERTKAGSTVLIRDKDQWNYYLREHHQVLSERPAMFPFYVQEIPPTRQEGTATHAFFNPAQAKELLAAADRDRKGGCSTSSQSGQKSLPGFSTGQIAGVVADYPDPYEDARGWLREIWRDDELCVRSPVMGYFSMTRPGVLRGPHEHVQQADLFLFLVGRFRLYLWDNRSDSPTFRTRMSVDKGMVGKPLRVYIPPGVVHGYQNTGSIEGISFNFPDQLYGGQARRQPVDEIRHELTVDSPFRIWDD